MVANKNETVLKTVESQLAQLGLSSFLPKLLERVKSNPRGLEMMQTRKRRSASTKEDEAFDKDFLEIERTWWQIKSLDSVTDPKCRQHKLCLVLQRLLKNKHL